MLNRSRIMKEAHKRTRQEMRDFPNLYAGYSYASVFAICLRGAWRDAKLGKFEAPVIARKSKVRGEILRLQMKTRMTAMDFNRWSALNQELRSAL